MKKILLATSAIIAVGLIAAPVMAAEKKAAGPIKLGVSGYMHQTISHTSQDDSTGQPGANQHNTNMSADGEVHFKGSTTLDNGVTVGVDFQLEGDQSGDQMDEHYVTFAGAFGKFFIGSENGAGNKSFRGSSVPGPQWISTWSSALGTYAGGTNGAANNFRNDVSGDSDKITYFTPKMNGFEVGVSYTWDSTEDGTAGNGDNTAGDQSNIWELGATYSGNTGKDGVSYNVSGAYIKGDNEATTAGTTNSKVWALGADVTFSGLTVAGGYYKDNNATTGSNSDKVEWNAGIKSSSGPWAYGISYSNTEVGAGAGLGDDTRDHWIAAASYAFGPGVSFSGALESVNLDDDLNAAGAENSVTAIHLGTSLFF